MPGYLPQGLPMNPSMTHGDGEAAVDQLYDNSIKPLPIAERLQLPARILNDIPPQSVVDYRTEWSEQDLREATAYSLMRSPASIADEDADA